MCLCTVYSSTCRKWHSFRNVYSGASNQKWHTIPWCHLHNNVWLPYILYKYGNLHMFHLHCNTVWVQGNCPNVWIQPQNALYQPGLFLLHLCGPHTFAYKPKVWFPYSLRQAKQLCVGYTWTILVLNLSERASTVRLNVFTRVKKTKFSMSKILARQTHDKSCVI